jgi:hypothetical protein
MQSEKRRHGFTSASGGPLSWGERTIFQEPGYAYHPSVCHPVHLARL